MRITKWANAKKRTELTGRLSDGLLNKKVHLTLYQSPLINHEILSCLIFLQNGDHYTKKIAKIVNVSNIYLSNFLLLALLHINKANINIEIRLT